jgi:hypothetical protein
MEISVCGTTLPDVSVTVPDIVAPDTCDQALLAMSRLAASRPNAMKAPEIRFEQLEADKFVFFDLRSPT